MAKSLDLFWAGTASHAKNEQWFWEVDCCPLDIQLIFHLIPGWASPMVAEAEGSTSPLSHAACESRGCLCWMCEHQLKCGNVFPMDILGTAPESKRSHCMTSEARLIAAGNHLFPCWSGVSKCSFYSLLILPVWCPSTLCHYLSLHPFSLRAGKAYRLSVSTPSLRLSKILSVA